MATKKSYEPDKDGSCGQGGYSGNTLVPVRLDKIWKRVSLAELASERWSNVPHQVIAWNGNSLALTSVLDCRLTQTVNKVVRIKLSNGEKLECSEHTKFSIYTERADLRVLEDDQTLPAGLKFVPAYKLKTGDRIQSVDSSGMKCEPYNALGTSPLRFVHIEKLKTITCEPTTLYSLALQKNHNVVLCCGVVGKSIPAVVNLDVQTKVTES